MNEWRRRHGQRRQRGNLGLVQADRTDDATRPGAAGAIEQARAILFLASEAAAYITGHSLTVDGGFHVS